MLGYLNRLFRSTWPSSYLGVQSSTMASYRKEFFSAGSIVSYFRTLFGRSRQNPAKVALESDKCWTIVDTDRASRDVGESVNEDTGPQPSAAFLQVQPPLPPECRRLSSKDIVIYGDHPARSGIFTDVWDGSLDGAPVVIKSYRLYSTADSTNICMVRSRRHRLTDP